MPQVKKPEYYQLLWDCIQYGLTDEEGMAYVRARAHNRKGLKIRQYHEYKREVTNGEHSLQWLSDFTRVGFVISHQGLIENATRILTSSNRMLAAEEAKPETRTVTPEGRVLESKDKGLILRLKEDIRQSLKLLEGFNLGTPVISEIRAQIQNDKLRKTQEQPITSPRSLQRV